MPGALRVNYNGGGYGLQSLECKAKAEMERAERLVIMRAGDARRREPFFYQQQQGKSLFRRGAETSTRGACAPRI